MNRFGTMGDNAEYARWMLYGFVHYVLSIDCDLQWSEHIGIVWNEIIRTKICYRAGKRILLLNGVITSFTLPFNLLFRLGGMIEQR